ncbi:hypothetical protein [uncultured Tateyamaria sp.]|uniref:hypothetical protein n=1 Tax=uncultured Tateyamaria sp. TaxID=455651 RepID=UPI00262AF24E|nr:hypothetical protein [uncultured Tateyamaria sp.]
MGFFALAGRNARVVAQRLDGPGGWELEIDRTALSGEVPIICCPRTDALSGVTVIFKQCPNENVSAAVRDAARYAPIDVICDDAVVERADYLEGAAHIETWKGIRIGVYRNANMRFKRRRTNANFHGVTLSMPLPELSEVYHGHYRALIDVQECTALQLVLPARKEVVRNAFLTELQREILRIYFRMIKEAGTHSLRFADHQTASKLGIDLPPAEMRLRAFAPAHANSDRNTYTELTTVPTSAMLFAGGDEAVHEQNFARALAQTGQGELVFEPQPAFAGYAWYDALPVLEMTGYVIGTGTGRKAYSVDELPGIIERPENLSVFGSLRTGSDISPWEIETDFILFADPDATMIDQSVLCLTATSTITHDELLTFFTDALFCPYYDGDAESYDTQLRWFTDEAEDEVIGYLSGIDDVRRNQVERIIVRELWWILRESSNISIQIKGKDVQIEGLETAFARSTEVPASA